MNKDNDERNIRRPRRIITNRPNYYKSSSEITIG